jgi:hypothetical protein
MSDRTRCPHCGAVNYIDDRYCNDCSRRMMLTVRDVVKRGPPPIDVQRAFISWWTQGD